MKNKTYVIAFIILICVTLAMVLCWNHHITDTAYTEMISLTHENNYTEALSKLKKANLRKNLEYDFKLFLSYDIKPNNKYYKDSWTIYPFLLAMQEYNANKDIGQIKKYLSVIPENYSGDLNKEISDFKTVISPEIAQYDALQAQKAEESRKAAEKAHNEFMAELKTKLPYKGMSERYIDFTMMGKHDEVILDDDYDDFVYNTYYWNANDGETMLAVSCINGEVNKVSKYFEWAYWTSDGNPNPNGKNNKNKYNTSTDLYDADEYSDPEEFYYDNYDDFEDYEDAEDYYNSYYD